MKYSNSLFFSLILSILVSACGGGSAPPAAELSLLAGNVSAAGSADGTGPAAGFYLPNGAATNGAGNIYVADTYNNTLRSVTPDGVVTTFAGTAGVAGHADGSGPAASFYQPNGVATDSAGNIYVTDTLNNTIRKITPAGMVTTLAGTAGVAGHADGTGPAASFYLPNGIVADSAGNLFVADTGNSTIREITPAGVVTTLAGGAGIVGHADGTGGAVSFYLPKGIAINSAGMLYVTDTGNNTIRQITTAGSVTTLAGTAGVVGHADGAGAAASFNLPTGIAVNGVANLYVADTNNSTIRKITPSGVVVTIVGQPGMAGFVPGGLPGGLFFPNGVAIFRSTLYTPIGDAVVQVTNVP